MRLGLGLSIHNQISSGGLDFSALTALPVGQLESVETAINLAATDASTETGAVLTAQDVVDTLALGKGLTISLPGWGSLKKETVNDVTRPAFPSTYDFYVDPTGDNANDGSQLNPWADLTNIPSNVVENGTIDVHVAAGTYLGSGVGFSNGDFTERATTRIFFENGVVLDYNGTGIQTCFDGNVKNDVYIVCAGEGADRLRITGFTVGTGNGLAVNNDGRLYVWNVRVDNCIDGVSAHSDGSYIEVHNSQFENCAKGACVHTDELHTGYFRNCIFVDSDSSSAEVCVNPAGYVFEYCEFIPAVGQTSILGLGLNKISTQNAIFRHCQYGNLTTLVFLGNISDSVGKLQFEDCFINFATDSWAGLELIRCSGDLRIRARSGTSAIPGLIDGCVFVGDIITGSSTENQMIRGQSGLANSGMTDITIENSVLIDFPSTVIGAGFSSTEIANWNAAATVRNCCFFNNEANYVSGIASSVDVPSLVTSDPQLDASYSTTVKQTDYILQSGSPCIGAGVSGGNIGFSIADLEIDSPNDVAATETLSQVITLTGEIVALSGGGTIPESTSDGVSFSLENNLELIEVSSPASVAVIDGSYATSQTAFSAGKWEAFGFESYSVNQLSMIKHFLKHLLGANI